MTSHRRTRRGARSRAHFARLVAPLVVALCAAGCTNELERDELPDGGKADETAGNDAASRPFGTPDDVEHARELWSQQLDHYRDWEAFAGLEGWQPGDSPHGAFLRYHVNDTAARDATAPGAIIVKENYAAERDDALLGLTVMEKIEGYAPEHGDWFWVRYSPEGEVTENDAGVPLAGRIGVEGGCISCHAKARGGDYVFAND